MIGIPRERPNLFIELRSKDKLKTPIRDFFDERRSYFVCKRLIDVVISLLVILFVLSWLIPLLAIAIKLDSGGPVFFVQRRVGFLGRTFRCIKIRTMVVNSVSDEQQAVCDDPRITRLGKFLRITSLDEFPQFFNVLIGDMSIVGPRPHMHADNLNFGKMVENYRFRNFIKPGITGMAQVKGYRGPAQNFHSIFHRYQWDAFYIRNASLALDFKIVRLTAIQTIKSIFSFKPRTSENATNADFMFARTVSKQ